ncbi:photosynthetic NDH subunit of subcomplex B 3, chloroplastic [Salvia miltiorrhiza]|uniref:photosynthetic NDH subunit of subcomplex B 3, chloroplastic n=1 Tax=Salvia miltiorrhiza TaxID=226208 RepID=UPI0025ABA0BE|nr:photosynthetic NDH subunit of subcomplex B 3, chloroplastic [Salvia miltiorrhiza]
MNEQHHTLINLSYKQTCISSQTLPSLKTMVMLLLQLNSTSLLFPQSHHFNIKLASSRPPNHLNFSKLRALQTVSNADSTPEDQTPPLVNFAFVHSVLLPDGTPDVHYRKACGGQKLREIMLDNNVELYGPYSRPLLNCGGGGTCATCMVEVVQGRELLNPRTEKEKEKLKKKPKNWRLACQAIVGEPDSRGLVVIQQLPEWKAHEWKYAKEVPEGVFHI